MKQRRGLVKIVGIAVIERDCNPRPPERPPSQVRAEFGKPDGMRPLWQYAELLLELGRTYTKRPGVAPQFCDAMVQKHEHTSVEVSAQNTERLHRSL